LSKKTFEEEVNISLKTHWKHNLAKKRLVISASAISNFLGA